MTTLAGKTVLVTRPKGQGSSFLDELATRGGAAMILSATEVALPEDTDPMDRALRHLNEFDWVVFTSSNGAQAAADRLDALGLSQELMMRPKIAVVGPSTGALVRRLWKTPEAMPKVFSSIHVAEAVGDLHRKNVLLLRGDLATDALPNALAEKGAIVFDAVAYRLIRSEVTSFGGSDADPDAIAFTSGENAIAAIQSLQVTGKERWLRERPIVCIGPNTAEAVRNAGYQPARVATPHSAQGLIEAVEKVLGEPACAAI